MGIFNVILRVFYRVLFLKRRRGLETIEKPPSVSPEGEGAIRMGKLMILNLDTIQMGKPMLMPKLPNLLKHLEGPGEEEVAVLVIDLDGAVVCQ